MSPGERSVLRCLASAALAPAWNMALDEALLRTPGPPTLRLYTWDPPGLSVGYFQSSSAFTDVAGRHEIVRRITGGGAIYHQDDLTFALTLDLELLPTSIGASYALVHGALARALMAAGVEVTCEPTCAPAVSPRPDGAWCLADPGPHDVTSRAGEKIVGSAQRRIRSPHPRVLHHGSLPIAPCAATPGLGSITDAEHAAGLRARVVGQVEREVAAALELTPRPGEITDEERRLAAQLVETRYGTPSFTHRR